MAKKIVYDVVIDSTDAQGSIKRIEERLLELNKTADTSQREVNSLTQELKELGQTRTDQTENINSVQSLRRAYRELIEELQLTEEGSERFQELAQAAGEVKNQIDAAQDSVNNFNKSPFENLKNNFATLKRRIIDLDLDGFKADFRDLAINVRNIGTEFIGIQKGAGIATNGLRVFRAALIGTGIGAVVVAIGTLIANFETLKESGGLIGNTFKLVGNIIEAFTGSILKLSDSLGLTSNAYTTYINRNVEAEEATEDLSKEIEKLKEELDGVNFDEKITKQVEEYNKAIKDLEKEQTKLTKTNTALEVELRKTQKQFDNVSEKASGSQEDLQKYGNVIEDILRSGTLVGKDSKFVNDLIEIEKEILLSGARIGNAAVEQAAQNLQKRLSDLRKNAEEQVKNEENLNALKLKLEELKNLRIRKLNADKDKTLLEDALKLLELQQKQQILFLLKNFTNEEELNEKKEKLDIEFLEKRKSLYRRFGLETIDLDIEIQERGVKAQIDNLKKLEASIDDTISKQQILVERFDPEAARKEDIENAERTIGLIQTEINARKNLIDTRGRETEAQREGLIFDLELANERIQILEDYGLRDFQIYEDAVQSKKEAELAYSTFLFEETEKRLANEEAANEKVRQDRLRITNDYLSYFTTINSQISGIINDRYNQEIALAGDNQEQIEEIQKEQFETNKAFGIVDAIINTAQGIMQVWGTFGANPVVAGILSGVVAAVGAAQVGLIASQQFIPGQTTAPQFQPNAQGSQSLGAISGYSPNIQFAQAGSGANIQTVGGGSPQSVQFTGSISVSEINQTQQLVNVYETGSLLGGG